MNQNHLARLDASFAVQHLPRRYAIDQHRFDKPGVERRRDRNENVCRNQNVGRPTADFGHGSGLRSDQIVADAGANGADGADEIVPGHKWKGGLAGIPAPAHHLLRERDAARLDLNEHLTGRRRWKRSVSYLQSRRFYPSRKDDFGNLRGGCGSLVRRHGCLLVRWLLVDYE
jgi:hypothetical protein